MGHADDDPQPVGMEGGQARRGGPGAEAQRLDAVGDQRGVERLIAVEEFGSEYANKLNELRLAAAILRE
jgi:hypothetical protein